MILGLDIGGSSLKLGRRQPGRASELLEITTHAGPSLGELGRWLSEALKRLDLAPRELRIAVCGPVKSGVVMSSRALGWRHAPLAASLSSACGLPVGRCVSDTVAVAAWVLEQDLDCSGVIMLLGAGVGGALIEDRRATRVVGLGHGEIEAGLPCACGLGRCLDAFYSSARGRARSLGLLATAEDLDALDQRSEGGDAQAMEFLKSLGRGIGEGAGHWGAAQLWLAGGPAASRALRTGAAEAFGAPVRFGERPRLSVLEGLLGEGISDLC